jgi:hypothetical protein
MTLPRRRFLPLITGAAALPIVSRFATAQTYPARPIKLSLHFRPVVPPTRWAA